MKPFFNVTDLDTVFSYAKTFAQMGSERLPVLGAHGRILAETVFACENLPDFIRSTMDGYAVQAASTFGASEANPAYLTLSGSVVMGQRPEFNTRPGQAARIWTGGALPPGTDSVVMIEQTEAVDETTIEVYKSVAPGQHVVQVGEDFKTDAPLLTGGQVLRSQEIGLLAAFGHESVPVFQKATVGIISTGDEVVPISETPQYGKIRDVNSYSLSAQVSAAGGRPVHYGIVPDDLSALSDVCRKAHEQCDMLLISGGSSVGARDYTIEALSGLAQSQILVHGIPISPGKPAILAKAQGKPIWGLPGHVTSAMVVFDAVVRTFLDRLNGLTQKRTWSIPARMTRNVPSAQGRIDFIRVQLVEKEGEYWAEPILGKSGLLHTMVQADGLVACDMNTEGFDQAERVMVRLL
ncbi:MAG: molybdopterin molybdotransferase MoeA [Deltaproteobacteria bacterium]|nr:molybdopterin molybdotransferase MoeA [Deltaproteobacteria bacterium]